MTDLWAAYFEEPDREVRADLLAQFDQADAAAVADPMESSSAEVELAKLLQNMLGYDHDLTKHARWLLEKCGGDYRGLRATLTAKAMDHDWLAWVWDNDVRIWAVRSMLVEAYEHREAREDKQRREATPEYRREKYAGGKYRDLIQS